MDLPTCPACKQSVLDDDAVECPFCGAPMKGGAPSARPAAAAAKPAAKPQAAKAAAPAGGSGKSRSAAGAAEATGPTTPPPDDDPFAVDESEATRAIPVSRQQAPGKSLEVVCPMCETKGYVTPRAAGKLVKCCNPKCMVPIFSAPAIEKKEPVAPPPEPKKKLPWLYIIVGVAAVIIAAVCIVVINTPPPEEIGANAPPTVGKQPGVNPETHSAGSQGADGPNPDKQPKDKGEDEEKISAADAQSQARDEQIEQWLRRLREVSGKIQPENKWAHRRLTATAYLAAGDKRLREELDRLEKSKQSAEALPPVTALAWQSAGRPAEFKSVIAEGEGLAASLPVRGRDATEAATAFAPLLVVSGKADQARQLIADHHSKADIEQVAAAIEVVKADKSFDLDRTLPGRAISDWEAPLDTAVVLILAAHDRWDQAYAWAAGSSDDTARTEGLLVWAESFARHVAADDAAGFARARKVAGELAPEGAARLLARLGEVKFSAGDRAMAEELLAQALAELEKLPPHDPLKVKGYKAFLDLKLPDAQRLWREALAATEIAGLQARLGQSGKAWDNVLVAMQFLSSSAPSWSAMQDRVQKIAESSDKVQREITAEMSLRGDDRRIQAHRYAEKLKQVQAATLQRFQREVDVLEAAANFGLLDQVWDELLVLDRKTDIHEREPLIATSVPWLLGIRYAEQKQTDRRDKIFSAVEDRLDRNDTKVAMRFTEHLLKTGDLTGCLELLKVTMDDEGRLHEWALRLACRLVHEGKYADAITFSRKLKNVLRDDALFLVSALAARTGHAQEIWKAASGLGGMDATAICAGLVVGVKSQPAKPVAPVEDGKAEDRE